VLSLLRKPVSLGTLGIAVVIGLLMLAYRIQDDLTTGSDPACFAQNHADLGLQGNPLYAVRRDATRAGIAIALDDYVGTRRRGFTFVRLVNTPRNVRRTPLPKSARIGAIVLGSLSDGGRDIGVPVVARATRSRDGRGINVQICTRRSENRTDTRPGRYSGLVRVAGHRIESGDVPVTITIKGARTDMFFIALGIALLGAALAASGAKPAEVDSAAVETTKIRHRTLALLPFLSGVAAGIVAGWTVYLDDPTWGAHRGVAPSNGREPTVSVCRHCSEDARASRQAPDRPSMRSRRYRTVHFLS